MPVEITAYDGPKYDDRGYVFDPITRDYRTFVPGSSRVLITSEERHKAILREYSNGATINQMCATFHYPRDLMRGYLHVHHRTHDMEPFSAEELMERSIDELAADAFQLRRGQVQNRINADKWRETSQDADKWRRWEANTIEPLAAAFREGIPATTVTPLTLPDAPEPFAAMIPTVDAHFGMRAANGKGRKEARKVILAVFTVALQRACRFGRPEAIYLPDAGDFLHVDDDHNGTRKGTPQDVDGFYSDILRDGVDLAVTMIELARQIAPVIAIRCPGNHDPNAASAVHTSLMVKYENAPDVSVTPYSDRQYVRYGCTLMGFTHEAKTPKGTTLGQIMATERAKDWAATRRHAFFTAHTHHLAVEDQGRCRVYVLPTTAAADRYTKRSKYDSERALPLFILTKAGGIEWQSDVEVR